MRGGDRHVLRPDGRCHHWRRRVARLLDAGELRRRAGHHAERLPPARRLPRLRPRGADRAFGAVRVGERPYLAVSFFNPEQGRRSRTRRISACSTSSSSGLVLEVGYTSNESRHLTAPDFSLNQVPPTLMGPGDTQRLRPFPQFSNVTWINPSIGRSSYHGVFVRAQKRFSDSFSVLAHYTWSRFLDDVDRGGRIRIERRQLHGRVPPGLDWARAAATCRIISSPRSSRDPPFTGSRCSRRALEAGRIGVLETCSRARRSR